MSRFWNAALLCAALVVPIAIAPAALFADDHEISRKYHDKKYKVEREWNGREDQAYRMYGKERHRSYVEFSKLHDNDQQAYWHWRHNHSDALLKIEIR